MSHGLYNLMVLPAHLCSPSAFVFSVWLLVVGIMNVSSEEKKTKWAPAVSGMVVILRAQVLSNLWSPNPHLHSALDMSLPVGSSCYLLPSLDLHSRLYTERKLSSEKAWVLQLSKTWKLLSSDSQTRLLIRITLGAFKKNTNSRTLP